MCDGARVVTPNSGMTRPCPLCRPESYPRPPVDARRCVAASVVRDIDAAARLGYKEPRAVRELIKRIWPEFRGLCVRDTVERTQMPTGGMRETTVREAWLTEAQLLKLIARSETPIAESILDEMIAVFIAVRRHLLSTVPVVAHERGRPGMKRVDAQRALPLSDRVLNIAKRVAHHCGSTPGQVLSVPLEEWADELKHQLDNGFLVAPSGPNGRYLLVRCSDTVIESLSRGMHNTGRKPDLWFLGQAAARALLGHSMIVDAFVSHR